jgi:hypothetical protein
MSFNFADDLTSYTLSEVAVKAALENESAVIRPPPGAPVDSHCSY